LQLWNEDNKPVQPGTAGEIVAWCADGCAAFGDGRASSMAGDVGRSMPTTTSTVTQRRLASRSIDQDTGRKESSARNFASRSGLDRLTACAARLRE